MSFVANPFQKLKSIITDVVRAMDASISINLKEKIGAGKTLYAKMVNNDKDIQRNYGANSILCITNGCDATIPSFYFTMTKLM